MYSYKPVKASPHTAPYKIHKYFARRPWNVFSQLIEQYSAEGDIVVDPFCGGGVTIYEGLNLKRRVVGYDLNPLSTLIVENMIESEVDIKELQVAYLEIDQYLKSIYGDFLAMHDGQATFDRNSRKHELWNELVFEVQCPNCKNKTPLLNELKLRNGIYSCQNQNCDSNTKGFKASDAKRLGHKYLSSIYNLSGKKVQIDFDSNRRKDITLHIKALEKEVKKYDLTTGDELIPLDWDRQYEDILERKGIKLFSDFFTIRNLYINRLLLHRINTINDSKPDIKRLLRLIFSSSLRDTNIMSFTVSSWQGGSPTTWSRHAFWIPNQFCEVNVRDSFAKAYRRLHNAIKYNKSQDLKSTKSNTYTSNKDWNVILYNKSIYDELPENSVDAIITDPPYGSNVQYLELSHFWYPWNKDLYSIEYPEFQQEAIFNRKTFEGNKNIYDYEQNLYDVFKHSYRILKNGKYMVLTFNNRDISAWLAILISAFRAGFLLETNQIYYQDGVDNYRQTAHTKSKGSPYGDFIYAFKKDDSAKKSIGSIQSEEEFIKIFKEIFQKSYFSVENDENVINQEIIILFKKLVPVIYDFVLTNLHKESNHTLYDKINKKFLDTIYDKQKK